MMRRLRLLVSFGIRHPAYLGLRFSFVGGCNSFAKCVSLARSSLGRLDALDAAPALASLGQYLTHLADLVVDAAVIAVGSFGHQFFLSGSGAVLGMVGLLVRPRESEQPAITVAVHTRANRRVKRRYVTRPAYHGLSAGLTPHFAMALFDVGKTLRREASIA